MQRVLITGATGLLGREIWKVFSEGHKLLALGRHWKPSVPRHQWREADLRDAGAVKKVVRSFRPQIIVHAAAIKDIDFCERFPQAAFETNTLGTWHLAQAAAKAKFVYISTDNVVDGSRRGHDESIVPQPLNHYGFSKLWGEQAARSRGPAYIVRTGWLFGEGPNFVTGLLSGQSLRAAADWRASPTYTVDLAQSVRRLVKKAGPDVYHLTNAGGPTRWEVAQELRRLGMKVNASRCLYKDLGFVAQRPMNLVLLNRSWRRAGFAPLRSWKSALRDFVDSEGTNHA